MSQLPDPIREGIARGWKIYGGTPGNSPEGTHQPLPSTLTCDVAIIGSGAGAGITAELLSKAGLSVIIIEEGPLKSSKDFNQKESEAYPSLYQESAARKTADKSINILQGRCVGGSTTVNWTSSFRTPAGTLQYWRDQLGLEGYTVEALAPYFQQAETRLSISPWLVPPNENNDLLRRGAERLGIPASVIARNVKGCLNLGSCGMGCPTNAKQSMLVTTIPAALDAGAQMLVETRAQRLLIVNDQITGIECIAVKPNSAPVNTAQEATKIIAKHYVLAAGAMNSPALLLRSKASDPYAHLGKRTFLHPVVAALAVMDQKVEGWSGAPQTIYSDHFLHTQAIDGPIGYKLEAPPLHPVIFSSTAQGFGKAQADMFKQFPNTHVLLALMRDGFHAQSQGGVVSLRSDGSPSLDYPLNAYIMDGARRALLSMAEIQFAAGAKQVLPVHEMALPYTSWAQAKAAIEALPMEPLLTKVVSAHVMGGCSLSGRETQGVTRPDGVHWQISNLSIHDGSLFPTSIGANPQLSIYGLVNKLTQALSQRLTGKVFPLDAKTIAIASA
jgi:choline dehydrogenase-like flavoprotein